eukprot:scaffold28321_cov236-Isochrysis_galbana.AAC.1
MSGAGGPSWSNSPVRLGSVKGGKTLDFCAYIDREKMLVYDNQDRYKRKHSARSGGSRCEVSPRWRRACDGQRQRGLTGAPHERAAFELANENVLATPGSSPALHRNSSHALALGVTSPRRPRACAACTPAQACNRVQSAPHKCHETGTQQTQAEHASRSPH